MLFVISIISVFIFISIYLFFRAENIQKELSNIKRETKHIKKDNQALIDAMVLSANKYEEFSKFKLQSINEQLTQEQSSMFSEDIEVLTLLTNNYSVIYKENLKGKVQLKTTIRTCLESHTAGTYNNFTHYIANQDIAIKRMWAGNDIQSFMSVTEALLLQLNKKVKDINEK